MKKKLSREKQCAKCPWKKSVDPNNIPNGYDIEKHRALQSTIAEEGVYNQLSNTESIHVMSCHEEHEAYCIGWLMNQLGSGNNIALRIKMLDYDLSRVEAIGEQHETFEDTIK